MPSMPPNRAQDVPEGPEAKDEDNNESKGTTADESNQRESNTAVAPPILDLFG